MKKFVLWLVAIGVALCVLSGCGASTAPEASANEVPVIENIVNYNIVDDTNREQYHHDCDVVNSYVQEKYGKGCYGVCVASIELDGYRVLEYRVYDHTGEFAGLGGVCPADWE